MRDNNQNKSYSFIGKTIDFIFEKKDLLLLILITLGGFILRFIIGNNRGPNADEMIFGVHSIDIINAGVINTQNQATLWMYLQDIFYKTFGITLISSRLLGIILGTATILAVYLLVKEITNDKKTALISSFLFSFSSYATSIMIMEPDPAMIFFPVIASYFLIKALKQNKISILAFVIIGIGFMIKALLLPFIPGFLLVYLYHYLKLNKENKKEFLNKKNIEKLIIAGLICIISVLPIITYNYLLYKEKGLTDVMFERFFPNNNPLFDSIRHTMQPFSLYSLFQSKGGIELYWSIDPLLLILTILGMIYAIIKNEKNIIKIMLIFFPAHIFTSSTAGMGHHLLIAIPFFAIISGIFIEKILENQKIKNYAEITLKISVIVFILYSIIWTSSNLFSESSFGKLRNYVNENIDVNSLVLVDARIYRGQMAWLFNDKNYLEASLFDQLINSMNGISQKPSPIKTYFIECAIDDCGWGTITAGQLNDSMEQFVTLFSNTSEPKKIYGGGGHGEKTDQLQFKIYEGTFMFKPQILEVVKQTHFHYFYPVRWELKDQIYDLYTPKTFFDKILNKLSYLILWLEIIIVIALLGHTIYSVYKEI